MRFCAARIGVGRARIKPVGRRLNLGGFDLRVTPRRDADIAGIACMIGKAGMACGRKGFGLRAVEKARGATG